MSRAALSVLVVLAAVMVLVWSLSARDWSRDALQPSAGTRSEVGLTDAARTPVESAPEPGGLLAGRQALAPTGDTEATPPQILAARAFDALHVLLLDDSIDAPIVGEILDLTGTRLATTSPTGQATLPWNQGDARALTFRAHGFVSTEVTPITEDLTATLVVRLSPKSVARVEVSDRDGAPFANVGVRVTAQANLAETTFRRPVAIDDARWGRTFTTDAAGVATIPLASRAVAELTASNGSRLSAWIQPTTTTRLVLDRNPATLRVVDAATAMPIPRFQVSVEETSSPGVRRALVEADEEGSVALPAAAEGLIVTLQDPRGSSATMAPDPRVTIDASKKIFRFDSIASSDTFTLAVTTCSVALRLVDEAQVPLEGIATVFYDHRFVDRSTVQSQWSLSVSLTTSVRLEDGHLHLDCGHLPSTERSRLRIRLPGYQDAVLAHVELVKNAATRVVSMRRGLRPLAITIRHDDGKPAKGRFAVQQGLNAKTLPMQVDPTGTIELRHWAGEDIAVYRFIGSPSTWNWVQIGTIPSATVQDGAALLFIESPAGRGHLLVEGVPSDAPPVFALDLHGELHAAIRADGIDVFRDLPEGDFLVGTRGWVEGLLSQFHPEHEALAALRTPVTADSEARIPWDSRWFLEREVTGRVIADPECLPSLELRPWYGSAKVRLRPEDELRVGLGADGRYVILSGEPVPERLLVCPSSDQRWIQVIQSCVPGEDVVIETGGLRVEWEGPRPETSRVGVLYMASSVHFDAPLEEPVVPAFYRAWNPDAPLVLGAVTTFVDRVEFDVEGYERAGFPVELRPGHQARITVSQEKLVPRTR